jgi:HSP20 family molecular chaperone IbpA
VDLGPGRVATTSGFQSFNETFPLEAPVIARELTKEFQGDLLVVRIPKVSGAGRPYNPYDRNKA